MYGKYFKIFHNPFDIWSKFKSISIFRLIELENLLNEKHLNEYYANDLNLLNTIEYKRNIQIIDGRIATIKGVI